MDASSSLKRTPLFDLYNTYGAKTVPFGGWDMPVQFQSILQEHEAVRTQVGLFDVSHMGEFDVSGKDALAFLQSLVTNDVARLEPGKALYSPMVYPDGGTVDDLLIYCFTGEHFWVVVNAGNIDTDYEWMVKHIGDYQVQFVNRSESVALLALQGPKALEMLQSLTLAPLADLRSFRFVEGDVAGFHAILSRTGYTGEDGLELYIAADDAIGLWQALMEAGSAYNLVPCGLGCRDTLRMEARLPLYGHELTRDISPLEAGLGMFVKLDKGEFVGREALLRQKQDGLTRKVVGLRLLDRGIPRADCPVLFEGKVVGHCTSGTMSPTLKQPLALAIVPLAQTEIGTRLEVDIRGKHISAEVVKTPFYKRAQA